MKLWIKEIGNTKPTIITSDSLNRPGEIYLQIPDGSSMNPNNYLISWVGDTPSVSEDTDAILQMELEAKYKILERNLEDINVAVLEADKQPFSYNGRSYYPDTEFIQGMFSMLPYLPSEYTETWKTAEKEADGVTNVYTVLDKAGIAGLAQAYLQFKKNNWLAGETQKAILKNEFLGD